MGPIQEAHLIPYEAAACVAAQRVLVLAPHPDDEVFGCGGCARAHVLAGATVRPLILTDGSGAGRMDEREAESCAAAELLGTAAPLFWREKDRELQPSEGLVDRLVDEAVRADYDLIYSPSPWEVHPDHRATAAIALRTWNALRERGRAAGPTLAFYEVGAPLPPNRLVDITAQWPNKLAAMACFASQLERQDYRMHIGALNSFRTYTLPPSVEKVEALLLPSSAQIHTLARLAAQGVHPTEALWRKPSIADRLRGFIR